MIGPADCRLPCLMKRKKSSLLLPEKLQSDIFFGFFFVILSLIIDLSLIFNKRWRLRDDIENKSVSIVSFVSIVFE